jgi:hypothetical protein
MTYMKRIALHELRLLRPDDLLIEDLPWRAISALRSASAVINWPGSQTVANRSSATVKVKHPRLAFDKGLRVDLHA